MERFPSGSTEEIPSPEEMEGEARFEIIGEGIRIENMTIIDSEDSATFRFRFEPKDARLDQIGDLWNPKSPYHPIFGKLKEKGWMDDEGKNISSYKFSAERDGDFLVLTYWTEEEASAKAA